MQLKFLVQQFPCICDVLPLGIDVGLSSTSEEFDESFGQVSLCVMLQRGVLERSASVFYGITADGEGNNLWQLMQRN